MDNEEQEIKEAMGAEAENDAEWIKQSSNKKTLPEAPMSIHIDSYLNGFHVGWTKRMDENSLASQVMGIKSFVTMLKTEGFLPSWNTDTNGKHTEAPAKITRACPKCGSPLVEAKTAKGKNFTKCSTNRWNRETGEAEGCDYVDWKS